MPEPSGCNTVEGISVNRMFKPMDGVLLAIALLLAAGAPLLALSINLDDATAVGKVTAYEAGKSLSVQVGDDSKAFKIDGETKIEGELGVGKTVEVYAKEGMATKIVVKE